MVDELVDDLVDQMACPRDATMKDVPSAAAKAEMLVVWRGEPKALLGADLKDDELVYRSVDALDAMTADTMVDPLVGRL